MPDQSAEVEAIKSKMLQKSYYLMFRNVVDGSLVPDLMLDHYQWLIRLEKQGKVFASGPMFDKDGEKSAGVTVFSTETWEEAEVLDAEDPFFSAGAMEYSLKS